MAKLGSLTYFNFILKKLSDFIIKSRMDFNQISILLWKNFLLKKRSIKSTLCLLITPLIPLFLLNLIGNNINQEEDNLEKVDIGMQIFLTL